MDMGNVSGASRADQVADTIIVKLYGWHSSRALAPAAVLALRGEVEAAEIALKGWWGIHRLIVTIFHWRNLDSRPDAGCMYFAWSA
jgi:hypothetical protein